VTIYRGAVSFIIAALLKNRSAAVITHAQNTIIASLRSITKYVEPYYGQLSDYNSPQLPKEELPKILVDFIGDSREGMGRALHFNLYFVHLSYSANKDYRSSALQTLAQMLESSESALEKITEYNLVTNRSKKLFDAAISEGYLSLFSRQITLHTTDKGAMQWMQ
jgi:hypothetical protein